MVGGASNVLRIRDTIAGDRITFNYCRERFDLLEVATYVAEAEGQGLGIDTESTGINCYRVGWQMRTLQIGDAHRSYVIPARFKGFIGWVMEQDVKWIGHNLPHDIRSIDQFLGRQTGIEIEEHGETHTPAHMYDSRNQQEGGVGHGLKEQAIAHIDRNAGKWEKALKAAFKQIEIPMPGLVYKSGPRKGQQRMRKANLSEGWGLIPLEHPAYIAYAAADPILAFRLYKHYQRVIREQYAMYCFDRQIASICDELQRRAIRLDVRYTQKLDAAYERAASRFEARAHELGLENLNSGQQIAASLLKLGAVLTERTPTGQYVTDDRVLRGLMDANVFHPAAGLIKCILGSKQMRKRKASYTESMLREVDADGRIHPSINPLGARTTRMSISGPPLQQLPTKDREADE